MKIINANYSRYQYPNNVSDLDDFIEFINSNMNRFIAMTQFNEDNCVFPYLVKDDVKTTYVNFSQIAEVFEEDASALTRAEYDQKLEKVVSKKCIGCEFYEEDVLNNNNLSGHRGRISLNGQCDSYSPKEV